MSKRKKSTSGAMLDLWRPPSGAGDPLGCLATTYTFAPGLFDEQCLARFLEIESEPNREDLAFLLERESRLGGVYAGVLVDHTQAGVEHSLRWDVLPVRIRFGKQHAKISVLSWTRCTRIIVASANLTEPGYRTNFEVAGSIDLTPEAGDAAALVQAIDFMRNLLTLVPGAASSPPAVLRAIEFLANVENRTRDWKTIRRGGAMRQQLVFTLPPVGKNSSRSSLELAVQSCRGRGGSPHEAWAASPFFDGDDGASRVTATLCKMMARGTTRSLTFCVPAVGTVSDAAVPRLAAPKSLLSTPLSYQGNVRICTLPESDGDKNRRPWHAKMLLLRAEQYSAMMIGSSNFTCAGMGVGNHCNAEANLLSIADHVEYGREVGLLESVWPQAAFVEDPEEAEWLGPQLEHEEEEQVAAIPLPAGFLSATYWAGESRRVELRLDAGELPDDWIVLACGREPLELFSAAVWRTAGKPPVIECAWESVLPPEKLLVRWSDFEAFMPLNVQDSQKLPPPAQLDKMSADDMLLILAATDPSAAFRAWARQQQPSELFDTDLDSAMPIDLDPLRRYDLQTTFLHRVRRRARVLAQLRCNLERPVWGRQALEWRLRGLVGIEPLAQRLVNEFKDANGNGDEALLTLADFLIVLREVSYHVDDNALPKSDFDKVFRSFLGDLAGTINQQVEGSLGGASRDLKDFWQRVVEQCRK